MIFRASAHATKAVAFLHGEAPAGAEDPEETGGANGAAQVGEEAQKAA